MRGGRGRRRGVGKLRQDGEDDEGKDEEGEDEKHEKDEENEKKRDNGSEDNEEGGENEKDEEDKENVVPTVTMKLKEFWVKFLKVQSIKKQA